MSVFYIIRINNILTSFKALQFLYILENCVLSSNWSICLFVLSSLRCWNKKFHLPKDRDPFQSHMCFPEFLIVVLGVVQLLIKVKFFNLYNLSFEFIFPCPPCFPQIFSSFLKSSPSIFPIVYSYKKSIFSIILFISRLLEFILTSFSEERLCRHSFEGFRHADLMVFISNLL